MSDTTTITPEEMQRWRERLTSKFSCFDTELGGFTLRLLDALEQAEANNVRLTKEFNWMAHVCSTQLSNGEAQAGDVEKWKVAARRAVADESEVNNDRN